MIQRLCCFDKGDRMKKICFVCHGNICRSPMAEFLFRDMLEKRGIGSEYLIVSRATSTEEIGNPVHHGTAAVLSRLGISTRGKTAVQLTPSDYDRYDLIIGMDSANIRNILRIVGKDRYSKVYKLLSFAGKERDIADPWYTGDFETTLADIREGCEGLLGTLAPDSRKKTGT